MKDGIERLVLERQLLGGGEEELHLPIAAACEGLATFEPPGRDIQYKYHVSFAGFIEKRQVGSRPYGYFQDVTAVQLHALHHVAAVFLFTAEEEERRSRLGDIDI